jgi:outer membrane protein
MKNLRVLFLTLTLMSAMALSAAAQTKVATVDMKKIFNNYWKTKQATAALENRKSELKKELKDMADGLEKAQADYKQLLDQVNDQALSADERDKRKQSAAEKLKEVTSSRSTLEQFQRQAEAQLADESQRMSGNLLVEIQKAVADKAKAGGFTLVLNAANSEAFIYVSTDNDITESVVTQLNAGAPIDLTKPMSGLLTNTPAKLK